MDTWLGHNFCTTTVCLFTQGYLFIARQSRKGCAWRKTKFCVLKNAFDQMLEVLIEKTVQRIPCLSCWARLLVEYIVCACVGLSWIICSPWIILLHVINRKLHDILIKIMKYDFWNCVFVACLIIPPASINAFISYLPSI